MIKLFFDPEDRLLSTHGVARLLDKTDETVLAMVARGELPRPVIKKDRAKRWRQSDIALWIALDCPGADEFEERRRQRDKAMEERFFTEIRASVRAATQRCVEAAQQERGRLVDCTA